MIVPWQNETKSKFNLIMEKKNDMLQNAGLSSGTRHTAFKSGYLPVSRTN